MQIKNNINRMKQGLKENYEKKIVPELEKELGVKNRHVLPCLQKIVVNIGLGRASQGANFQEKILPEILKDLAKIVGQKPAPTTAKKSIAGFKLRQGQTIGLKATLRGKRMYDFADKLVKVVYPRVRDFRGIDLKNVDKKGNLNLGFKDHFVFAEINQEVSSVDFGLQVTLSVKARNRDDAIALFKHVGFLFKHLKESGSKSKRKRS
jgi:large subunit ribosomal protein L5